MSFYQKNYWGHSHATASSRRLNGETLGYSNQEDGNTTLFTGLNHIFYFSDVHLGLTHKVDVLILNLSAKLGKNIKINLAWRRGRIIDDFGISEMKTNWIEITLLWEVVSLRSYCMDKYFVQQYCKKNWCIRTTLKIEGFIDGNKKLFERKLQVPSENSILIIV